MSKFWSPKVRELTPYVPGEQPRERLIKLNTNENPYPPAPGVEAVLREFPADHLRRYPDPESHGLREALAREFGVEVEQVFVGNGSDEVLALAFQAFFANGRPLEMPAITYSFYPVYCRLYDVERRTLPLDADWRVDLEAFSPDAGGAIFANPNAPTGHGHGREAIAALLERLTESVVLVDEAYVDFGGESAIPLIERFPNLLVTGTFSKSRSLAGLRLGYAVGSRELIEGLERVKDSFNSYPIDSLASAIGVAALEDREHFDACREAVITTRERTRTRLESLGFQVLPSQSNFLLVHHPEQDAAQLFVGLRERGVLVRHFNTEALDGWLRISIGTEDEMDSLVEVLEELCR
ncbi:MULTISPECIES: histidinol-phosphate transaminase [Halomonas]|uniref:Histidinol-phosphate aminotransferase n=1 Tax=Halomonas halophila TaxID=29573 RepID=A0ABQ0U472_9GAMM|nr:MULTISPECIES: histidinol-phosphate transaminase [Halomonas]MDR5890645.1 histidinol-phosphate transaminase [Halomonas salina]WJY07569.1 histidinol-phosphate transaminase [Halomonas halophila]GEK73200.1 histidinol-phosphate aminotransferase [Halomonas halophila]